jgi:hypothetical protein
MFIATTHSPDESTTKDKAIEDFMHLLARACEYVKELEDMGKTKKGVYMPLYENVCNDAKKALNDNWSG